MSTTAIKTRPILFNAASVRAILADRKAQTRRIVKLPAHWSFPPARRDGSGINRFGCDRSERIECPFGVPGDRLWVRETWGVVSWSVVIGDLKPSWEEIVYRAGPHLFGRDTPHGWTEGRDKWRSSIHMPRLASRLTLEIQSVRVERLQAITEADALAEGCDGDCPVGYIPAHQASPHVYHFAQVWESIHGRDSWDRNEFVWVIGFRRIDMEVTA